MRGEANGQRPNWLESASILIVSLSCSGQMMLGTRPRTTIPLPLIGTNEDRLVINAKISQVGEMTMPELIVRYFNLASGIPRSRNLRAFYNEDNVQ